MSVSTANLVRDDFALEVHIKDGDEAHKSLEEGYGICQSFLVMETQLNMSSYALRPHDVTVSTDYDFSEVLHTRDVPAEASLAIDEVLLKSRQQANEQLPSCLSLRGCLSMLSLPGLQKTPVKQRRDTVDPNKRSFGGRGEVRGQHTLNCHHHALYYGLWSRIAPNTQREISALALAPGDSLAGDECDCVHEEACRRGGR